ncbi:MAG: hypothetical protein JWM11_2869 [Planctomycetaceae bacterium]|nr:hypothetical protein [Planctomycetaceae bacterium]
MQIKMSQEIMTRKDKQQKTAVRGILACLMLGTCVFGLIGCGDSPKDEGTDKAAKETDKPLVLASDGAQPKAVLSGGTLIPEGIEFDFGSTEVGQEFTHVFHIKNEGDGQLAMKKGAASCQTCTSFEVDKLNLNPGETAAVTVKWKIGAENPQFRQFAPIETNMTKSEDGLHELSTLKFYVKGQVVQRIVISPKDKWDFGNVPESGQLLEFTGTISSAVLNQFEIVSLKPQSPKLVVKATPFSPEQLKEMKVKSGYNLKATLEGDIPIGEFTDKIALALRTPNDVTLNVDVVAKRTGPIEIFGQNWDAKRMMARLGAFDASKDFSQRLNLYTRGFAEELQIKKQTSRDPRYSIEIVPDNKFKGVTKDHRRYDLFIKYKGSKKDAAYSLAQPLELELETNLPKVETIKLTIISQGTLRD